MKRVLKPLFLLLLLLSASPLSTTDSKNYTEYEVKAVFLGKFPTYIEWPKDSDVHDKSKPFVIGIIGENPFVITHRGRKDPEDLLKEHYKGKKILKKDVIIQQISDVRDIPGCHILFVSKSMAKNFTEIVETARQNMVLTIADTKGFAKKGIHINFYIERGNVKFEINQRALLASGLQASYHLFKIAKVIEKVKK